MTEEDVAAARKRAEDTAAEVERLERESQPTEAWEQAYALAAASAKAAERRAASTARIYEAQQKRQAERAAQVKASAKELRGLAAGLDATVDQLNAAVKDMARATAAVVSAASAHNAAVASARSRLLELGLSTSDDLGEHDEGATDQGAMLAGKLRAPVDPAAALQAVIVGTFKAHNPRHPLARTHLETWRLEAAGVDLDAAARADVPRVPDAPRIDRPTFKDLAQPGGLRMTHPDWKPPAEARRRS